MRTRDFKAEMARRFKMTKEEVEDTIRMLNNPDMWNYSEPYLAEINKPPQGEILSEKSKTLATEVSLSEKIEMIRQRVDELERLVHNLLRHKHSQDGEPMRRF